MPWRAGRRRGMKKLELTISIIILAAIVLMLCLGAEQCDTNVAQ